MLYISKNIKKVILFKEKKVPSNFFIDGSIIFAKSTSEKITIFAIYEVNHVRTIVKSFFVKTP